MIKFLYILVKDEPVEVDDIKVWGTWFERADRRVAVTRLPYPPLLYETMIFGGPDDGYCDRYTTKREALRGHRVAVEIAIGSRHWRRAYSLLMH